ncbi:MAG TPA: 2,3-diaminopropionate biosynthesis protein SbnB [Blastocatellia bacterium]|nr:2,3-diaminopropionate biosynthesis protein SbnB [Blastocatellia bacterium]
MNDNNVLLITGNDVRHLLECQEVSIIDAVAKAYVAHAVGDSSLPHSTFLRFPSDQTNRIIALPAYLGGEFGVAGVKWISSFPGNLALGIERASAAIILNSSRTGRPEAILEGSIISAKRTAASAALAARELHSKPEETRAGVIGCGVINLEIVRFLLKVFPKLSELIVYDLDTNRADRFSKTCKTEFGLERVETASNINDVFESSALVSIATTALQPHITEMPAGNQTSTILHISLRDLSLELILNSDNIVDDPDHVSRAQTSIHLAEQVSGHRGFIRATLADILMRKAPAKRDGNAPTIFSPFGLGVLDLAVSKLVCDLARTGNLGTLIPSFLPDTHSETQKHRAGA